MKYASVLRRALVFGALLTAVIAVVGSVVGYLVAGFPGLASALIGTGLTAVFMGFTTVSILFADRATKRSPSSMRYFSIILGVWALKFVVFIGILLMLRGLDWINPFVFFVAMIAAVIGSLITDVLALAGARVPYVGDIELPGATEPSPGLKNSDS